MEYYKSYTAVKKNEGDLSLYILLWNNGQGLLTEKNQAAYSIYIMQYFMIQRRKIH